MKAGWILTLGGAACLLSTWRPGPAQVMWNATASVPVGLYSLSSADRLAPGDLVVVRPPAPMAALLAQRGWLPAGVPLLKPVAALEGQLVCRHGVRVVVDGVPRALARTRDRQGRPLPAWSGCRRLGEDDIFVLNQHATDSFDGRYFGVVSRTTIQARATPLWLPSPSRPRGERP